MWWLLLGIQGDLLSFCCFLFWFLNRKAHPNTNWKDYTTFTWTLCHTLSNVKDSYSPHLCNLALWSTFDVGHRIPLWSQILHGCKVLIWSLSSDFSMPVILWCSFAHHFSCITDAVPNIPFQLALPQKLEHHKECIQRQKDRPWEDMRMSKW